MLTESIFFWILKNKKKFWGVVEITALLLPKITLRKFVSVKSGNNNPVISTTPCNFFSKPKKSPKNHGPKLTFGFIFFVGQLG